MYIYRKDTPYIIFYNCQFHIPWQIKGFLSNKLNEYPGDTITCTDK